MPRSAEYTRKRILDAAYVLFRRKGYTRVCMDDIAAAPAVTKRSLYYHFESKDQLLTAVLEAQHHLAFTAFQTIACRGRLRRSLMGFSESLPCGRTPRASRRPPARGYA